MRLTQIKHPIYNDPRVLYEQQEGTPNKFRFGLRVQYAGHLRIWIDWNPDKCPVPVFVDKELALLFDAYVPDNYGFFPGSEWDPKFLEVGMRVWGWLACGKEDKVGELIMETNDA